MRNVHICECHLVLHSSPSYHFAMFKNDLVCITRQHYVAEGARHSLRKKYKKPIKLVFNPQNGQINFIGSCFFLSVCFVFFLGYWVLSLKPRLLTRDQLSAALVFQISAFRRGGPANHCKRITSQHHTTKHERKVHKMYKI
jgi:hypothetical protein